MKSFIFKILEDGKADFLDKEDKGAYRALLLSLKRKGISKFKMTLELETDVISDKQEKLFNTLIGKISQESGQDRQSVEQTLLNNYSKDKKSAKDFSKEEFQVFIEQTSAFCIEFWSFSVEFDKNGHIEIKSV